MTNGMERLKGQLKFLSWEKAVGTIMVTSVLLKLLIEIRRTIIHPDPNGWGYSEFLINFEGGFVRRGLLGEILYWIADTLHISPLIIITALCAAAYLYVTGFLVNQMSRKGYRWWLVLSPLMCGLVIFVIRKDYILFAIMIAILQLVSDGNPALWKRSLASVLALVGLMLHEAFIFWGIPIFALVMISQKRHRIVNVAFLILAIVTFIILCYYKGNTLTVNSIITSWNDIMRDNPLRLEQHNSIGALSWTLTDTIKIHMIKNLGEGAFGLVYWPICYMVTYYLVTFYFSTQKIYNKAPESEVGQISALYLLVSVCLLPMFAFLSCDYGRLFQYATVAAVAAYLILDDCVKDLILPHRYSSLLTLVNNRMRKVLPPGNGLMVLLLLILGISPKYYDPTASMIQSPIGSIGGFVIYLLHKAYDIIL